MEKTKHRGTEIFFQLTRRHLLVFFKNKVRVMYTLLVPVIIFAVYIFFLRELELSAVRNTLHDLGIAADAAHEVFADARRFVDALGHRGAFDHHRLPANEYGVRRG